MPVSHKIIADLDSITQQKFFNIKLIIIATRSNNKYYCWYHCKNFVQLKIDSGHWTDKGIHYYILIHLQGIYICMLCYMCHRPLGLDKKKKKSKIYKLCFYIYDTPADKYINTFGTVCLRIEPESSVESNSCNNCN